MGDETPKLTLDDLLIWGRDWDEHVKKGPGKGSFLVPRDVLEQFLPAAIEALALQRNEQARKLKRSRGGRPTDDTGEQVMRLVANGVGEADALRMVARERRKAVDSVLQAYDSARGKSHR